MKPDVRTVLRRLIKPNAIEANGNGPTIVAPESEEECAQLLKTAGSSGWTTTFKGLGRWWHDDQPADIAISTRRLNRIVEIKPDDLFATVEAGVPMATLQETLRASNTWIPIDAPGTHRTIGSVASTATAGGLQARFGPVRDQILGMTIITATGRTIVAGGRVVKNVAGFDIPKLVVGSFGAFGLITRLHLRIRVSPESDVTVLARDNLDELLEARERIVAQNVPAAAWEIRSPTETTGSSGLLAVRVMGSREAVERHLTMLAAVAPTKWDRLTEGDAADHWELGKAEHLRFPVTVRVGPQSTRLASAIGVLERSGASGFWTIVSPPSMIRWSGDLDASSIQLLRTSLAQLDAPLTVERAPWPVLSSVGHFGSFRLGVSSLVRALETSFDPHTTITTPIAGV